MSTNNICFHGEKKKKDFLDIPSHLELCLYSFEVNGIISVCVDYIFVAS